LHDSGDFPKIRNNLKLYRIKRASQHLFKFFAEKQVPFRGFRGSGDLGAEFRVGPDLGI
jgi:hypothetical protein